MPTQKAARDRLREAQNELSRGRRLDEKALTVAAYLEYWLDDVIQPSDLQPKSKQGHAYYAELVRAKIGHIRLDQLTAEDIERCLNELRVKGGRHGIGHAASSLAHIRNTLRKALGHAVKNGRLPRNMAVDAAPPKVRREEDPPVLGRRGRSTARRGGGTPALGAVRRRPDARPAPRRAAGTPVGGRRLGSTHAADPAAVGAYAG